jgi:hypothetical protein
VKTRSPRDPCEGRLRTELSRYIHGFRATPNGEELLELDLNFDHKLALGEGSSFCNFGVMWLASVNGTGHQHIVLLPMCDRPAVEWPVAFYEEEDGTAEIFASSIKTWGPAYLIYVAADEDRQPYVAGYADAIIEHCKKHWDFDATELVRGFVAKKLSKAEAYRLVDPGSYLYLYHELVEREAPAEELAALARAVPFYNAPLARVIEMGELDDALAWEVLHRNLRWDFGRDGVDVRVLGKGRAGKDARSPFEPLLQRIDSDEELSRFADGFFEAGEAYESKLEWSRALTSYENAIFLRSVEDEELHRRALLRVREVVKQIGGGADYLAWLEEEVRMPDHETED